jgi:hypothetical protein
MVKRISCIIFFLGISMTAFQSCIWNHDPIYDISSGSIAFEDVQAAVDFAQSGDVVRIAEGKITWRSTLKIPNDKKITLLGSGRDKTVISSDTSSPSSLIDMGASGSRITDMGFRLSNDNGNGITVRGEGWRIDNCRFDNTIDNIIEGVSVRAYSTDKGSPVGLVDHCVFNNIRVIVCGDASLMANHI